MMTALERRDIRFVLAEAAGSVLSSTPGFLPGAWPFGVVEFGRSGSRSGTRVPRSGGGDPGTGARRTSWPGEHPFPSAGAACFGRRAPRKHVAAHPPAYNVIAHGSSIRAAGLGLSLICQ
jgi:hypothetical protein